LVESATIFGDLGPDGLRNAGCPQSRHVERMHPAKLAISTTLAEM